MIRILISTGMIAATICAVEAAPKCAPGKIYRVSKKVCVDKTVAVRDGIIFAPKASATRNGAKQAPPQRQASEVARETSGEASQITQVPRSETTGAAPGNPNAGESGSARAIILAPVKNIVGWTKSPFGALMDPWTSDGASAAPETSFSLKLSTAD